jgi:hypothetical protein
VNCALLTRYATVMVTVPRITIKTGFTAPDGREEALTEYMCDTPGCPNVATQVLGRSRELGVFAAVCPDHLPAQKR